MQLLTIDDLEALSLGCAVLGSGGGGDPGYAVPMAKYHLEQYGPAKLISIDELKSEDLVVPIAIMGAPLINMERLLGKELESLLSAIEKHLGRKPTVLMAGEIGGANAFTPLLIASKCKLPILDADLIGRAFPQLQMNTGNLKNLCPTPAFLSDCLGNTVLIETPDAATLEKLARPATVAMGSSSGIAFYLMNGDDVHKAACAGTFSQALKLGSSIQKALKLGSDPISALDAQILARGIIVDVDQSVKEGFLQGSATIHSSRGKITLFYQNEYLLVYDEHGPIATTPDIFVLMEEGSGTPITSEMLRYGLQVALLALPAPEIWQTPEGLALVGPKAFGYDIPYQPIRVSI